MILKDRISDDIKKAMKAQEKQKLSTLRMLLSDIKYAQVADSASTPLSDAEVLKVISTFHKRLEKSLVEYPEGPTRNQLLEEIEIVKAYLPQKAGREETERVVERILSTAKDTDNFGILMKAVLAEMGDSADPKMVSELIKAKKA